MEEQINPTSPKNSAAIWAIVIAIIAVALVVGVYWWQNLKTSELQQTITDLQNQVEGLKMTQNLTEQPSESTSGSTEQKVKVSVPVTREQDLAGIKENKQELDTVMLDVINMACLGMSGRDLNGLSQSDQTLYNGLLNTYCGRFAY